VQPLDRRGLFLRRSRGLEGKDREQDGIADGRKRLLDHLLRLSPDRSLYGLLGCRRRTESFDGGGAAGRVRRQGEGEDACDTEDANDGGVQDNARTGWSTEGLSLVLPSSVTGDKPAGMPPGPDGGPPEKLPELAFLQQNFDTRRAYLNSTSQQ
jgi:hypothetical protein